MVLINVQRILIPARRPAHVMVMATVRSWALANTCAFVIPALLEPTVIRVSGNLSIRPSWYLGISPEIYITVDLIGFWQPLSRWLRRVVLAHVWMVAAVNLTAVVLIAITVSAHHTTLETIVREVGSSDWPQLNSGFDLPSNQHN